MEVKVVKIGKLKTKSGSSSKGHKEKSFKGW
jgi:hypothetical protein